ncbi:MAG: response regulator [Lachnospiraceae bacterium]|nr:response regulator [Lachnospiraceae bacterium]
MNTNDFELNEFVLTKKTLPIIREFAEHIPGGFVIYQENENRDIIFINNVILDIYKCDTLDEFKELTGYTFTGMVHPDDFSKVQDSIDAQVEGKHGSLDHVEYRITTRDGKTRWIDDYGHFSHSEDYGDLYYVFLMDITEKHLAMKARSSFFFRMSHELLTPMNAISNFIKLALGHKDDPSLLIEYLEKADGASDNMIALIDDLVEINRASIAQKAAEGSSDPDSTLNDETGNTQFKTDPGIHRVLVAEDNEINQILLQTILEEAGFEVETVDDGMPAYEMICSHPEGFYNIVLMDIQMKKTNGFDATRLIRELPGCSEDELPIIALSANSRDDDIRESMESGMNAHLAKPYDPVQIVSTINRFCHLPI